MWAPWITRCAALLLAVCLLAGRPSVACAADDDPVLSYLTRLGLGELRLRHLERALAAAPAAKRDAIAKQLADGYAERLLASAADQAAFDELLRKVENLRRDHKAADTPSLSVVLLQARYQAAEAELLKWYEDAKQTAARDAARKTLIEIAPELVEKQAKLTEEIDKRNAELENLKEPAKAAAEAEIARLQAAISRAAFFAGWANYYLAVLDRPTPETSELEAALAAFRTMLELGDIEYDKLDPESLGLESVWRARAVIGLGLTHAARKEFKQAHGAFAWLMHPATPATLRDQATFWELQGYLWPHFYEPAARFARSQVEAWSGAATPGKSSFCVALLKAGYSDPMPSAPQRELGELGVRGLAKLRQFDTLAQLVEKYGIGSAGGEGFYLRWLRGRQKFFAAEKMKKPEDYRAAEEELRQSLNDAQASKDPAAAAQAKFHLAWCQFRLGEFEPAAKLFHEITPTLKEIHPETAAQAAWMEFGSYQVLAGQDKKFIPAAVEAAQAVKRDYPDSPNAVRIDVLLAKLRQAGGANDESIAALAKIKPGEPSYLAAQFELVQLYHQQWSQAKENAAQRGKTAPLVMQAADRFVAGTKEPADAERRLKAALLAMDVLAAEAKPDWGAIGLWLNKVQTDATAVSEGQVVVAEYHYRQLQAAQQKKDDKVVRTEAAWLAKHAQGTPYELPALILVARMADAAVDQAAEVDKGTPRTAAVEVYRRLARLVGEDASAIAASRNALAANSRLALYLEQEGRWTDAAERLETIVAALPTDKSYLRRAGRAWFLAGKFGQSLPHWRKLITGLTAGSDDWYEAKYHQLACLQHTDPADAKKVWQQFKLLYPEIKSAAWKDEFLALGRQIETA